MTDFCDVFIENDAVEHRYRLIASLLAQHPMELLDIIPVKTA